jgi:hypothetical protein
VHPSLFCLVNGVSLPLAPGQQPLATQWLPAEFNVSKDVVTITSEINNLPRWLNSELYTNIAEVFACFVPLFEETLGVAKLPNDVQVIVKIAEYELGDSTRTFEGGNWHLEGTARENIAATGIYYYRNEGIGSSVLEFRLPLEHPGHYEQYDDDGVYDRYGVVNGQQMHEYIGCVDVTEEGQGLCIAFPNNLQHRVRPFALSDDCQSGNRGFLVFWLVDPNKRILSTAQVPLQQAHFVKQCLYDLPLVKLLGISVKLIDLLVSFVPGLQTLDEAKLHRDRLMFERKFIIDAENEYIEREFSLCEH